MGVVTQRKAPLAMKESESTPSVRYAFMFIPQTLELAGGSWEAFYPGDEWSVTAESREAAIEKLKAEELQRVQDPDRRTRRETIKRQHLVTPVPGVYAMDADLLLYLRDHKVSRPGLERAFEEAECRRAAGRPYTVADYQEHAGGNEHA